MKLFSIILMLILSLNCKAQKITKEGNEKKASTQKKSKQSKPLPVSVLEGNLTPLASVTAVNVEFVYDSMIIGKDVPEQKFVEQRIKNWNEQAQGKGEEWSKYWYGNRKNYEAAFLNTFFRNSHITSRSANEKYTLILKTKRTETGWNTGMMQRAASIDGEVWFVETADHTKVIAKFRLFDIRGRNSSGGDFEMASRIIEAYARAGEVFGSFIK